MIIASIDIGTNTILLLIAQINFADNSIKAIFEDQKIPRIGEGLKPGSPISQKKIDLLLDILKSFQATANNYKCEKVLVTATNAFRIASNRNYLIQQIQRELDLEINVISGSTEASFAFLGATYDYTPNKNLVVIDIGGGSTEITFGRRNKIISCFSLPIGVVTIKEKFLKSELPRKDEMDEACTEIKNHLKFLDKNQYDFRQVIAVAGTPTTLACMKKGLESYNEKSIEKEVLDSNDLMNFINQLSSMSAADIRRQFQSVVSGREDVLLAGTILLKEIMQVLGVEEVIVSAKGVRYGAILDYLQK